MKKTILMMAVGAAASVGMVSCANEEPIESAPEKDPSTIEFRPAMGSRAAETTNANLSDIYVTAFMKGTKYFGDVNFSKGTDNFFTSDRTYYWPGDTTSIEFFSYSPSLDKLGADITEVKDTLTLESFQVAEDIADQVDFITANMTASQEEYGTAGVPLTFAHRLSQIEVRAKNENTAYVVKVVGVRIGRAEYIGSFNFKTNKWTLDDWHDTAVYTSSCDTVTLSGTPQNIMGPSGNAMLIPQTLIPWSPLDDPDNVARESYLSVLVNISTPEGVQLYPWPSDTQKDSSGKLRKSAWAAIPLSGTWEQGKKYIYTLDFTRGAGNIDPDDPNPGKPVLGPEIKMLVNVEPWTDSDSDIPMTPVRK